jgi:hypothetical protein
MTINELRIRLSELVNEYAHNKKLTRQILTDIDNLDSIMARNFDADWCEDEQIYTQGL